MVCRISHRLERGAQANNALLRGQPAICDPPFSLTAGQGIGCIPRVAAAFSDLLVRIKCEI